MSKLEELIRELCPNGVEYKKFDNVCQYIRGITYNKTQEAKMDDVNPWKVMRANNITLGYNVLNFEDIKLVKRKVKVKKNQLLQKGDILICAGSGSKEHIGKVAYIFNDMDYTFGGFMAVIRCDNELNSRFLFHILTGNSFSIYLGQALNSTTINNLNAGIMKNFLIPIPPLPVQREIVRILDNFAELTAELKEKLTAELTARKKQYEYYRESLLTFRENTNVAKVKLKEICEIYLGLTATPNYTDSGVKFISAQNISKDFLDLENVKYISESDYEKATSNAKPKRGDLLFTRVGSNIGHPVIVDTDEKLCVFVSLGFLRIKNRNMIIISFLKHWMNTELFWSQVRKNVHGAAKVNLNTGWLKEFEISLPCLEEQHRIVSILDRFDTLCNDLTSGLPAEIEARQKQYEYYRDKLLNFNEKES